MNSLARILSYISTGMPLDKSSGIFVWSSSLVNKFGDGVLQAYGKTLAAFYDGNVIEINLNNAEIVRLDTEYVKKLFKLYFGDTHKLIFIQCSSVAGYVAYNCSVGFYYRETLNNDVIILPTGANWIIHKPNYRECVELCERYLIRSDNFMDYKSFILRRCDNCYRPYILDYDMLKHQSGKRTMFSRCCNCQIA